MKLFVLKEKDSIIVKKESLTQEILSDLLFIIYVVILMCLNLFVFQDSFFGNLVVVLLLFLQIKKTKFIPITADELKKEIDDFINQGERK